VTVVRSNGTHVLARGDSGSALAEIAVVLPMLVLLLIGLIEAGRFGSYVIMTANAARAGVQYGAQNTITALDIAGMKTSAKNDAQNDAGLSANAVTFCQCADGTGSTCLVTDCASSHRLIFVEVDTTGTWQSLTHFPGLPTSLRTITVQGKAVMRVAQ
jgi:Flp pilus assembly protein TadG